MKDQFSVMNASPHPPFFHLLKQAQDGQKTRLNFDLHAPPIQESIISLLICA